MSTSSHNHGPVQNVSWRQDRPQDIGICAQSGNNIYFMPAIHATSLTLAMHGWTSIKTVAYLASKYFYHRIHWFKKNHSVCVQREVNISRGLWVIFKSTKKDKMNKKNMEEIGENRNLNIFSTPSISINYKYRSSLNQC